MVSSTSEDAWSNKDEEEHAQKILELMKDEERDERQTWRKLFDERQEKEENLVGRTAFTLDSLCASLRKGMGRNQVSGAQHSNRVEPKLER